MQLPSNHGVGCRTTIVYSLQQIITEVVPTTTYILLPDSLYYLAELLPWRVVHYERMPKIHMTCFAAHITVTKIKLSRNATLVVR